MAEDTPEGMASDSNVPGGILKRKWDEGKTAHGTKAGFSGVGHVADFSASGDSAFEGLPPAKRRKFTPKVQFEAGGSDVPVDVPQKRAVSDSLRERTVPLTIHRAQNDGKEPQPPLTIKIPPRRVARRYNLRAKPKASKRAAVQSSSKRNAQTKVNKPYSARPNTRVACPQYDTCQQTFARKGDATRHAIETHNGKRHECLGCRRWFSRADALHRHQRSKCGDVMRQRSN
ncbi:hypothetical protein DFH06DRAFT_1316995 [Mycena polygramma]|nr:hypothetical protein DFH06DRAFT_1316995 [Mycena polygramma]